MVLEAMQCAYILATSLIFAVLNFLGFRGSTAICESLVL